MGGLRMLCFSVACQALLAVEVVPSCVVLSAYAKVGTADDLQTDTEGLSDSTRK